MNPNSNFWQPKNLSYRILIAILLSFLVVFAIVVITNGSGAGPILIFLGVLAVNGIWKILLKSAPEKSNDQVSSVQNLNVSKNLKLSRIQKSLTICFSIFIFFVFLFSEAFMEDLMFEEILFSIFTCILIYFNIVNLQSGYVLFIKNITRARLFLILSLFIFIAAITNEPLVNYLYKDNDYYNKYPDYKQLFIFFISFILCSNFLGIVFLINNSFINTYLLSETKPISKSNSIFKAGDLVKLKSGGPAMVIATVENSKIKNRLLGRGDIVYYCQWIDSNSSEPRKAIFNESQLLKTDKIN
jgi:uncharacterized protein YodC (DUF2158 family)